MYSKKRRTKKGVKIMPKKKAKRLKLERKLDEFNHIMELVRTVVPIAVLVIQIVILTKLIN